MISLHSHSGQFCRHAKGTLEEVVQAAIGHGFTTYGLSEHMPRYRREELYPEEQDMQIEDLEAQFDGYIAEATRLKARYADKIELLIGLETENISPESLDKLDALLERHSSSIQYIVGSVHHSHGYGFDFDKATFNNAVQSFPTQDNEATQLDQFFGDYFDAQYALLQRFRPEVIGHFDLCRLFVPTASLKHDEVWPKVVRNVEFAVSYGALFEVNAAAFRKGWKTAYPDQDILELILGKRGKLTLSDDSHGPQAVGNHYKDAHRYLVEQDVKSLWYLTSGGTERGETNDGYGGHASSDKGTDRQGARAATRAVELPKGWLKDRFWERAS